MTNNAPPRILFFVAVDWFFCSHFMERALAARDAGFEVIVVTHVDKHGPRIEAAGLRLISVDIDRRSLNPLSAGKTLAKLVRIYRRERPVLLHQVALKPILLGSLAARLSGIGHIVNAVVGGGYLLIAKSWKARLLRPALTMLLKLLLNPHGSKVVFENGDDLSSFVKTGLVRTADAVLIRGAGVDPHQYQPAQPSQPPMVVMSARLLWDKGLGEFVEAARILRQAGVQARFVVAGDRDPGNRASINVATLEAWKRQGDVEFWGFQDNMPAVLAQASIACLPSYREGLPKALLEAMACGIPCVSTDVQGCREAVRDGDNGLLVPPADAPALAAALRTLLEQPALRAQMGQRGRERINAEFASALVLEQTLALYRTMLGPRPACTEKSQAI
ncbi:glycosyl transferase family 1 [Herbaspirillum rubrisubalbicans]|uniref:Glycosyl transferase family 1 n=1 Tax=Herbaspirillum rubrisubalbicans TaxID=80842 RepID=A0ABX9BV71_9BURK|nr:glycosyltransferase family 4 protein [Herbaspirillum rubrisubalbicans]RAM61653.1 glycosyl transferase family 1 [Herbaspirillum rubrisubalbicans]RAN44037.1 glycosyl transferase family 1 [Herbaspirillum rubrisubalbicans]